MPHSKFNWRSTPPSGAQNTDGTFSFAFGETWKLTDHTLVKPENAKGCTLDVSLEHDSKVTQLQLVCNASALQVSVVQAMNAQEFKWITQMRGTPLPNQPDMYYFRTPEELLTQKLWRLRVKFLFSSTSFTSVRIQTLSLSFDKLTRRSGGGAKMGGGGGVGMPQTAVANPGALGRSSGHSHSHHPMLYRGGSMSTTTSTTASMTTTPTGSSTPCSDSVYGEDVSEISEEASTGSLHSRAGSTSSSNGAGGQNRHTHSSSGGGGGSSRRRADREAIGNLLMVIDQVIGQGGTDRLLIEELQQLKTRLQDHLSQRSSDQDLNSTIARISSIVQSIMR